MQIIKRTALILCLLSAAISTNAYFSFDSDKFLDDVGSVFTGKPEIKDLIFARGITKAGNPVGETRKFTKEDTYVYVFLKITNFKGRESVSAQWSYDNNGVWEKIGNVELTPPKDAQLIYFYITRDDNFEWPVGEYKVDISMENQHVFTRYFDILEAKPNISQGKNEATAVKKVKGEPEIFNIVMSKDLDDSNDPVGITDIFLPGDKEIYLFFNTRNVNSKDKLSSKWYYMENSEWEFLAETTIIPPEKTTNAHFMLRRSQGTWDEGEYKAEIFVRGLFKGSKIFTISGSEAPDNASQNVIRADNASKGDVSSEDDFSL